MRPSLFHFRLILAFLALNLTAASLGQPLSEQTRHTISVSGTRFLLDGAAFPYTGVSFFNAIYSPAFNKDSQQRLAWLRRPGFGPIWSAVAEGCTLYTCWDRRQLLESRYRAAHAVERLAF